jgi:sortase A
MIKKQILKYLAYLVIAFVTFELSISYVFYMRGQVAGAVNLYHKFQKANGAIGLTDLSPLPNEPFAVGDSIALIKIPAIQSEQIVFEGSQAAITQKGIGHMSGSAGIAERGMSVLVGRRTSWGAPFAYLPKLKVGDKISTTTVAGTMDYKVVKLNATFEDLNIKYNKSMLALMTSSNPILGLGSYIVLAEAQKNPYPPTPQNRKDDGVDYNLFFVVYLLLIITILFFYKQFVNQFDKIIAYSIISPTLIFLFILFAKELDKLMSTTL